MKKKFIHYFVIITFLLLYVITSLISTFHVIDFFALTNPHWLAISLAIAFEIGAAASLSAIIILDKTNRAMVWFLFILLTSIQINGNMYWAYKYAHDFKEWMELFGLSEEELILQKRILAVISGAILPIVALGFIKSLVDYIRPKSSKEIEEDVKSTPLMKDDTKVIDNITSTESNIESTQNNIENTQKDTVIEDKKEAKNPLYFDLTEKEVKEEEDRKFLEELEKIEKEKSVDEQPRNTYNPI